MNYFGTRLSDNLSRREPEGYLLCLNVPVARTGIQEYLPEELCLPPPCRSGPVGEPLPMISVFRPPEEVFSPETIASFEGMPVTDGHPPDGVDIGNIRALQKGHAHNIRRGSREESDLLLADLIITDQALIRAILEEGKREISCGYTYELCEENGQYIQRKIRGNHVAVVDTGRAGPRVSIKDEHPVQISDLGNRCRATGARDWRAAGEDRAAATIAGEHPSTDTTYLKGAKTMKKSLSKVLARMAKDGDIETVAEIIEEMIEPAEPEEAEAAPEPEETQSAGESAGTQNIIIDEDGMAGILERLDRIIGLLSPAAADEAEAEEVTEAIGEALEASMKQTADPVAGEIAAVMEEVLEPAFSTLLEENEDGEECGTQEVLPADDALRAALTAVRPALARMPKRLRDKMAGDIASRLRNGNARKTSDAGPYAALSAARCRPAAATAELGRRIMEKRNANYRRA